MKIIFIKLSIFDLCKNAMYNSRSTNFTNTSTTFIDSDGFPFIYEKTIWCKLKYYKIRKIEKKGIASVLWLHGVTAHYVIPRPPHEEMKWAGMIHYNNDPWLLYEYAEEKLKDSRRKI